MEKELGPNKNYIPKIHEAMTSIMNDVGAVAKSGKNDKQNYGFRRVDDVYAALQLLMAKFGVYTTSEILNERGEERKTSSGGTLLYRILTIRYTFWCKEDGSSVQSTVIGEGMDSGDKASNKAMSVAHKYALCQAFTIPTDEPKDPENDHHEVKPKNLDVKNAPLPAMESLPDKTIDDYIIDLGPKNKISGKHLYQVSAHDLKQNIDFWSAKGQLTGKPYLFVKYAQAYLNAQESKPLVKEDFPPFTDLDEPQF